ncbi:MAG: NYN domain protein, partial [Micrococcaceae bacterium]|nr:NYN domain protein [Micrococcaceae bacterium]
SVADNWYVNTTQRELTELQADRPLLPPEIDRVLLKDCAQQIGEWKTDIQVVRRTLRASFWDRLDELT